MIRMDRVAAVARKELRETLRDRKTLFLLVLLPVLLYPLLLLVVTQVAYRHAVSTEERTSVVALLGDEAHPVLAYVRPDDPVEFRQDLEVPEEGLPEGADLVLDLREAPDHPLEDAQARIVLRYSSVDPDSQRALRRLERAVDAWQQALLVERLATRELPPGFAEPVIREAKDAADRRQRGGHVLGALLPILVLATVLIAATYPAIDATVGERERGTLQTLLTAPLTIPEILGGKFVAVLTITLLCGAANLLSLALLFGQNLLLGAEMLEDIDLAIPFVSLVILLVAIVLQGVFLSALLLATVSLARSYKEAQVWVLPAYVVAFAPAIGAQMPGVTLDPALAMVPSLNTLLLMKEALTGSVGVLELLLVTGSTLLAAALLLRIGAALFSGERILLGAGADGALLERWSPGQGPPLPKTGQALALCAVLFVLFFYVGTALQTWHLLAGVALTLWVLLLAPPVALARYLRLDLAATFQLRPVRRATLVLAVVVGLSAWAPTLLLADLFARYIFEIPPEMLDAMRDLFPVPSHAGEWVILFLVIAVTPAICEEALFRGFLFTGLRRTLGPVATIALTAIIFGIFHMSLYRLVGTTFLGVIMGWMVWRTRSIWPAVIVHLLNNSMALFMLPHEERLAEEGVPMVPLVAVLCVFLATLPWVARMRPHASVEDSAPGASEASDASSPSHPSASAANSS